MLLSRPNGKNEGRFFVGSLAQSINLRLIEKEFASLVFSENAVIIKA